MNEKEKMEPIFEGGPTQAEVDEMKEKYGKIYMTSFEDDSVFIWRMLTRKEYKEIMKAPTREGVDSTFYKEERITEACLVWPTGYDYNKINFDLAGIASVLSEQIMAQSGFVVKSGPIEL